MAGERETVPFDVLIVGGGPAGLAAAIRLSQLAKAAGKTLEIGVVEKAAQPGLHCLSGAVLDTRALAELLPDFRERGFPAGADVAWDSFCYLTPTMTLRVPGPLVPPRNRNHGKVALSIQKLVAWLAQQAEAEGVTILTETCGVEVLYGDGGEVTGVRTGDKGLGRDGKPMANAEPGYDLQAAVTIFAEGGYGTLSEDLATRKGLRTGVPPQVHSLGVKELIRNDPARLGIPADEGFAIHTLGFPLPSGCFGGGFLYHLGQGQFSVGYVLSLSWGHPALDLHAVFNEFKKHPLVQRYIRGGEVLTYGAKTIPEGGWFAVGKLHCDGALVVGESAGLVNVRTLKGIHYAMKSGMLAAETAFEAVQAGDCSESRLASYRKALDASYVMDDIRRDRNFRSTFDGLDMRLGLMKVMLHDLTGGGPTTPSAQRPDWKQWHSPQGDPLRRYPCTDFDPAVILPKLTDVHRSGTSHREDQPSHIRILDPATCSNTCMPGHGGIAPCTHFCPAAVYELKAAPDGAGPIQVNFSNCVHCRTCVIVDPCDVSGSDRYQNIEWRAPAEGGPRYAGL